MRGGRAATTSRFAVEQREAAAPILFALPARPQCSSSLRRMRMDLALAPAAAERRRHHQVLERSCR